MSFAGILATGLAGGASAMGAQLTKDIANQEEMRMFAEKKAIEEQAQLRLLDYQDKQQRGRFLFERDTGPGGGGAAELGMLRKKGEQSTDEEVRKAGLLETQRVEQTKREAADPAYMAAVRAIKSNDPLVAAQIAHAMAAAGASAAHTAMIGEQLRQLKNVGQVADTVRGLQSQLANANDETQREAISQKISDLGFTGKDPAKFLALAEKAQDNAAAALKILADPTQQASHDEARKQLARALDLSEQAAAKGGIKLKQAEKPTEAEAHADAAARVKAGAPLDMINARLVANGYSPLPSASGGGILGATRRDPITHENLDEKAWNKKYGKGDFKNIYAPGEDSLKAF